jgi:hypothetical protein
MKLTGQNWIAIAIAGLALVVAGTGTAVAVTSTTTISDPTNAAQKAKVDSSGRLSTTTAPLTSTIAVATNFYNSGKTDLTSPTWSSLAITGVLLSETRLNGTTAGSDLSVSLVQTNVNSDGTTCGTVVKRYFALANISSGDHVDLASAVPVVVAPISGAKYCLGLLSQVTNGAMDVTPYFPRVSFTGHVTAGGYTGTGTAASPGLVLSDNKAR